jgi:hypothetical protein
MTRASFLVQGITMQLESKYRSRHDKKSTIISSQIKENNFVRKLFFAGTF